MSKAEAPLLEEVRELVDLGVGSGQSEDFSLGRVEPVSPDFIIQSRRSRKIPSWGIDFSRNNLKFNWRQRKDFRACFAFMREALWCLGGEDAESLIDFLSLYAHVDTATYSYRFQLQRPNILIQIGGEPDPALVRKLKFAEVSKLVLREILGSNGKVKTFKQVSELPKIEEHFVGLSFSLLDEATKEKFVERIFYFWMEVFHQVLPNGTLRVSSRFEKRHTIVMARQQAGFTLERAMMAIMMFREVIQERSLLAELGVSLFQQELWCRALVCKPRSGCKLSKEDILEEDAFRLRNASDPRTSLEGRRKRELILEIPQRERLKKFMAGLDELMTFLEKVEDEGGIKCLDQLRTDALRWFRQRSVREKGQVLRAIIDCVCQGGDLKDLFKEKRFSPSVRHKGKRIYKPRKDIAPVLGSLLEMALEYIEAKPLGKIKITFLMAVMNRPEFNPLVILRTFNRVFLENILVSYQDSCAARALAERAKKNLVSNNRLINRTVKDVLSTTFDNFAQGDFYLNKQQILKMMFAACRCQFSPTVFLDNFRTIIHEDLPGFDGDD